MSGSNINSKRWQISKKELVSWLDGISEARTLFAPKLDDGVTLYLSVKNCAEISWDEKGICPTRPNMSAKEIFFPQTDQLFTINKSGQNVQMDEVFPEWETVIFGIRPCDAHGIKILDAVFIDTNPEDVFYSRRRSNTTLIGFACSSFGPNCFCTSVGGAPDNSHDMDIMVYEDDGDYMVEAVTQKGRFLIPGGEWKVTDGNPKRSIPLELIPILPKEQWSQRFDEEYWGRISERCISCRACTYVCPTCRCFIVRDEVISPGNFERVRCWDACAGKNFRLMAGGHRSRAEKVERFRNRFFCKFLYFPEQYGLGSAAACTGCGRCIEVCPVGVDITEVLLDLEKLA